MAKPMRHARRDRVEDQLHAACELRRELVVLANDAGDSVRGRLLLEAEQLAAKVEVAISLVLQRDNLLGGG